MYIPEEAQWLAGAEVRTGATADRRQGPLWGDDWTVGMVAQLRKFTRNYRTVPIKEMSFMGCMLYLKKIVKKQRKPRQVSRLLPGRGPARPSVSRRAPRVPCVRPFRAGGRSLHRGSVISVPLHVMPLCLGSPVPGRHLVSSFKTWPENLLCLEATRLFPTKPRDIAAIFNVHIRYPHQTVSPLIIIIIPVFQALLGIKKKKATAS